MSEYSETLKALRREAGYPSAWAFYKARGPRLLGATFKAYVYLEKGRSLPQAGLARRVADALGLAGDPAGARRYGEAYLRTLLGRPELSDFLLRSLEREPGQRGMAGLFQRASKLIYAGRSLAITRAQADALLSDWRIYWCFIALSDDVGRWTPEGLGQRLGIPAGRARACLETIVRLGLFKRDAQGRYYCPHVGKAFNFPRDSLYLPRMRELVRRNWEEMGRRRGATLFDRYYLVRGSEAEVRGYFAHLAQMAWGSRVFARSEGGPDTAFVAVTTRARKLFAF